jgi:uroporphyrinogen decarboxylase
VPLSSRQRVLTTLNHQQPDRTPTALWGSWYGITDPLYFAALDALGWEPVAPFRPEKVHSVNYYDDRLLRRLGCDVRHVDPGSINATSRVGDDGRDAYGLTYKRSGLYRAAAASPLENATVDEVLAFPLPQAEQVLSEKPVLARLAALEHLQDAEEEYAISGRAVASYGLFEMAQSLRKHDKLLLDLHLEPDLVHALVARLADCYGALIERFLDIAGPRLDILEMPGDDFAGNVHPIIAPAMFDEFFRSPYTELFARIKAKAPHLRIAFHSDGAIKPFLPRLIDIGVDIVHPLEPLPATDMGALKAEFGDRIVFMGGIDIRTAMQGDAAGVEAEARRRMELLGPGGGYILAPANHLQRDVPAANLFHLYDAVRGLSDD